jgi:hypothetical protein
MTNLFQAFNFLPEDWEGIDPKTGQQGKESTSADHRKIAVNSKGYHPMTAAQTYGRYVHGFARLCFVLFCLI